MNDKPPCSGRKDDPGTRSPFTARIHIIIGHICGEEAALKWPEHALHKLSSIPHKVKSLKISRGLKTDNTAVLYSVCQNLYMHCISYVIKS